MRGEVLYFWATIPSISLWLQNVRLGVVVDQSYREGWGLGGGGRYCTSGPPYRATRSGYLQDVGQGVVVDRS